MYSQISGICYSFFSPLTLLFSTSNQFCINLSSFKSTKACLASSLCSQSIIDKRHGSIQSTQSSLVAYCIGNRDGRVSNDVSLERSSSTHRGRRADSKEDIASLSTIDEKDLRIDGCGECGGDFEDELSIGVVLCVECEVACQTCGVGRKSVGSSYEGDASQTCGPESNGWDDGECVVVSRATITLGSETGAVAGVGASRHNCWL